jgi:hypothetical protein
MDIPTNLPTDSLYKFKTFVGMLLMVIAVYLFSLHIERYQSRVDAYSNAVAAVAVQREMLDFRVFAAENAIQTLGLATTSPTTSTSKWSGGAAADVGALSSIERSADRARKVYEDLERMNLAHEDALTARSQTRVAAVTAMAIFVVGFVYASRSLSQWERKLQKPQDDLLHHQIRRAAAEADLAETNLAALPARTLAAVPETPPPPPAPPPAPAPSSSS